MLIIGLILLIFCLFLFSISLADTDSPTLLLYIFIAGIGVALMVYDISSPTAEEFDHSYTSDRIEPYYSSTIVLFDKPMKIEKYKLAPVRRFCVVKKATIYKVKGGE